VIENNKINSPLKRALTKRAACGKRNAYILFSIKLRSYDRSAKLEPNN